MVNKGKKTLQCGKFYFAGPFSTYKVSQSWRWSKQKNKNPGQLPGLVSLTFKYLFHPEVFHKLGIECTITEAFILH